LNEKYEPDADWKNIGSLWSLKQSLSKDKFIKNRQPYFYFIKKQEKKEADNLFIKPDIDNIESDIVAKKEFNYDWLPEYIINDAKEAKTVTSNIIKNIYDIKKANTILNILENVTLLECKSILLLLTKSLYSFKNDLLTNSIIYCKEMREYINELQQEDISIIKYAIAKALCFPGSYNTKLILPNNIPENLYPNIKKQNYKNIIAWDKTRFKMTEDEINDYLAKMREKQKDVILDNLNRIDDDNEKQIINDMKNFKLIKFTEIYKGFGDEEIPEYNDDIDEDIEGENDFIAETTNPDDLNEDILD
jgi:GTPase SAR1 family protein